jgi:hypothetical protein
MAVLRPKGCIIVFRRNSGGELVYYSNEDVKHLLDSLRNSYETEVVEYKEAKSSFGDKDLGKYTQHANTLNIG